MSGIYKDAKDWLQQNAEDGVISIDQLVSFALCNADNDDIERWFGVSMESNDDNPGSEQVECPLCGYEVDDLVNVNGKWEMCEDCETRFLDGEIDEEGNEIEEEEARPDCAICGTPLDVEEVSDQICGECGTVVLDNLSEIYGWWHNELVETGTGRIIDVFIYDVDYICDGVHAIDTNIYSRE
jgi:hypothetical protein